MILAAFILAVVALILAGVPTAKLAYAPQVALVLLCIAVLLLTWPFGTSWTIPHR